MIVGSGNVVHNLRRIQWDNPDGGEDWARRFDDSVADLMAARPGDLLEAAEHPDFARAVPTPDHFIPLLYTAGLAAAAGGGAQALVRGYAMGSLSMSRSAERRVGKEGGRPCRSRWSPATKK